MGGSHRHWLDASFTSKGQHDEQVAALCADIRRVDWAVLGRCSRKSSPYNSPSDVPGLNRIIAIDLLTATATVEANMTMEALAQATLPFGFLPSVVAGDRAATVSDAFAATTSESSSFAFGTFDCTVTEIEIVLGDGQLVYARPDDDPTADLFYGSAGGLNSLGLITALEVCLVRAGPYVELTFRPATTAPIGSVIAGSRPASFATEDPLSDATQTCEHGVIAAMDRAIQSQGDDFVEAVLSNRGCSVVVSARFTPKASYPIIWEGKDYLRLSGDLWRSKTQLQVCMPTISYLFRNTTHPALQRSAFEALTSHRTDRRNSALGTETMKRESYGVSRHGVQAFLQAIESTTCLIRPVMQPKEVGRKQPLGIARPFDFEIDCCTTDAARATIETILVEEVHLEGFPYLQCRASGQREPAWVLHNDRWHLEPWLFHDDRWYVELRSQWNAEAMADVSERVACSPPLRFHR